MAAVTARSPRMRSAGTLPEAASCAASPASTAAASSCASSTSSSQPGSGGGRTSAPPAAPRAPTGKSDSPHGRGSLVRPSPPASTRRRARSRPPDSTHDPAPLSAAGTHDAPSWQIPQCGSAAAGYSVCEIQKNSRSCHLRGPSTASS